MPFMTARHDRGFTLLELMISVAIVAILATIAIPGYLSYVSSAQVKSAQMDVMALSLVMESQYQRSMAYPVLSLSSAADIHAQFSSWSAAQTHFDYSLVSTTGGYTITATANSGANQGCQITIDQDATRTSTCLSSTGSWL